MSSSRSSSRRLATALLALVALTLTGCGPESASEPETPAPGAPLAPILMVGVDGLEWSVLRPLLEAGRLPHIADLMERGSYGRLGTFIPTHSPVVWTSIATSKDLRTHGIQGFIDQKSRVYTSTRRANRALWNIASEYGRTVNVFGWWVTWPVEEVNGIMVSASSAASMMVKNWKGALVPGLEDQVHPPELEERIMAVAERAGSEQAIRAVAQQKVFGPLPAELPEIERVLVESTLWSVVSDETYYQVAKDLLPDHLADLNMVYFGGPDVAGHRFWRHYRPWEFAYAGESPEVDRALMCTIPNYYIWVDEMIGGLIEAAGGKDDLIVMVLSDHGMHANATEKPNRVHTTGDHQDAPPGVLIVAGPGIRQQGGVPRFLENGALPTLSNVYSIAPDVLGMLGIPGARDMRARAYRPIFTPEAWARIEALPLVDSHDEGFRAPYMEEMPKDKAAAFAERFQQLGYVMMNAEDSEATLVNPELFAVEPSPEAHPCH